MFLRPFSVLIDLGADCVGFSLLVRFLPVNAIEIAQSTSTSSTAKDFVIRGVKKGEKGIP